MLYGNDLIPTSTLTTQMLLSTLCTQSLVLCILEHTNLYIAPYVVPLDVAPLKSPGEALLPGLCAIERYK
jgi:hypothetical protein